jgi:hypothetical protein
LVIEKFKSSDQKDYIDIIDENEFSNSYLDSNFDMLNNLKVVDSYEDNQHLFIYILRRLNGIIEFSEIDDDVHNFQIIHSTKLPHML